MQSLNLKPLKVAGGEAELLLPFDPGLCRVGGTICGQALMAAADTAMVFAIASQLGEFRPMTTVGQNISFMRPVAAGDVRVVARVLKPGRSLFFGEVEMIGARRQAGCARDDDLCDVVKSAHTWAHPEAGRIWA